MLKPLLFTAIASAGYSSALSAQAIQDVRCLILSNAYAQAAQPGATKTLAASAALYYAGKLDGRWSDAQLKTEISRQKVKNSALASVEMQACAKAMTTSLKRLSTLSREGAATK